MTAEKMYEIAKRSQKQKGTSSSGEIALADFLKKLEEIDWKDLHYRFADKEILDFVETVIKKTL